MNEPFTPREDKNKGPREEIHPVELFGTVYRVGFQDLDDNYMALVREDGKVFWVNATEDGRLVVSTRNGK